MLCNKHLPYRLIKLHEAMLGVPYLLTQRHLHLGCSARFDESLVRGFLDRLITQLCDQRSRNLRLLLQP